MPDDLHRPVSEKRISVAEPGNSVWRLDFCWNGEQAEIEVAAFPWHALYVNNRFVGSDEFAFTTTYDLAEWLDEGVNTLEILLVSSPEGGWFCVDSSTSNGLSTQSGNWQQVDDSPLLEYELRPMQRGTLDFPWDGGGKSYKALPYLTENPAGYVIASNNSMFPTASDIAPYTPDSYASFTRTCTLDFGKETTGYTSILIDSTEECRIRIAASESFESIDADPWYHADVIVPVSAGANKIVCPLRKGYRYLKLTSDKDVSLGLQSVTNLRPYREFPRKGSFRCSDDLYNRIFEVSAYTIELCAQKFLEDGVKRDRLLWTGDLRPMAQVMYLHFGDTSLAREALYSFARHTNHNGLIQPTFPWRTGWVMADYVMWWIVSLDDYLIFTGDVETLRDLESVLNVQAEWLYRQMDASGRFVVRLYEDAPITCWSSRKRTGTTGYHQGLWIKTLECLERLFSLSGRTEDARSAGLQFLKARTASAMMLSGGYARDYDAQGNLSAAISLDSNLHLNPSWLDTGRLWDSEFGLLLWSSEVTESAEENFIMPLYNAYAFENVFAESPEQAAGIAQKCFGHMLNKGATTFWERYGLNGEPLDSPMTSLCHGWSGYMAATLLRIILKRSHWLDSAAFDIRQPDFDLTGCLSFDWVEATIPLGEGMLELKAEGGAVGAVTMKNESGVTISASILSSPKKQVLPGNSVTFRGNDYPDGQQRNVE